MTEHSKPPADGATPPLAESAVVRDPAAGSDPTWQAPWLATPGNTAGAAQQPAPPQTATGHYGPGYADPTRHTGNSLPGRPDTDHSPNTTASGGAPSAAVSAAGAGPDAVHAQRAAPTQPDDPQFAPQADRPPDISSEEVGVRPPDRAPSDEAPASENAALIFERS